MRVAAAFGWRLLVLLAVGYVALQVVIAVEFVAVALFVAMIIAALVAPLVNILHNVLPADWRSRSASWWWWLRSSGCSCSSAPRSPSSGRA